MAQKNWGKGQLRNEYQLREKMLPLNGRFFPNFVDGKNLIFVFEQHFPFGIQNAQLPGENPASHISTGFPVFNIPKTDTGLGFLTPGGNMMGNTKLSYGPFYDLKVQNFVVVPDFFAKTLFVNRFLLMKNQ